MNADPPRSENRRGRSAFPDMAPCARLPAFLPIANLRRMATSTDSDSAWRRAVRSLGAHVVILEAMLTRMRLERDCLPADDLAERILADRRISNAERDLRLIRARLLGLDDD